MKLQKIIVIDYGIGNVKSILNAFDAMGCKALLSADESQILEADGVILPGVGAFKIGMENLNKHNLIPIINKYVNSAKLFLGICLGMNVI